MSKLRGKIIVTSKTMETMTGEFKVDKAIILRELRKIIEWDEGRMTCDDTKILREDIKNLYNKVYEMED